MNDPILAARHFAQIAAHYGQPNAVSRFRIPCPAHSGNDPNAEIALVDSKVIAVCYSHDCGNAAILGALERQLGIPSINYPPRDNLAVGVRTGEIGGPVGQFASAMIYGPIWPSTDYRMSDLLPLERMESVRRERGYRCDAYDNLCVAMGAATGMDPDTRITKVARRRADWPYLPPTELEIDATAAREMMR